MSGETVVASRQRWERLAVKLGINSLAGFVAGVVGLGLLTFRGVMRLLTITSGQAGLAFTAGVAVYVGLFFLLVHRLENSWRMPKPLLIVLGVASGGLLLLLIVSAFGNMVMGLVAALVLGTMAAGIWSGSSWQAPVARILVLVVAVLGWIAWIQASVQIV
ncbi:MAG: hypothetical protein ACT4OP_05500 [Actinomycetota bacterium]